MTERPAENDLQRRLSFRVRRLMFKHGMTQRDLANLTDMSQHHINQMLTGSGAGSVAAWDALLKAAGEE